MPAPAPASTRRSRNSKEVYCAFVRKKHMSKTRYKVTIIVVVFFMLYIPYFPLGFWASPPTGSMRPEYKGCDIMLYGPGFPSEGDVMTYQRSPGVLVIHRIVEENGDRYVFKGDNNPINDGEVDTNKIVAEIYHNIELGVDRDQCIQLFKQPINTYYKIIDSSARFSTSAVNYP